MATVPEIRIHRSLFKGLGLFAADPFRWLDEAASLGPLVALRFGPVKTWIVTDADTAREMLVPQHEQWKRPPTLANPIRLAVGDNLFTQSERAWARVQPRSRRLFAARRSTSGSRRCTRSSTRRCTRFPSAM